MVLRKRIAASPRARRPLTHPLLALLTCHRPCRAGALLLFVLFLMYPGRSIGDPLPPPDDPRPGQPSAALALSASETRGTVRLRIRASGDIEPGSIELRFADREAVVLARDAEGRTIRSLPVRLPAEVVEEGASADYEGADVLVITLRKQAAPKAEAPGDDPEASTR